MHRHIFLYVSQLIAAVLILGAVILFNSYMGMTQFIPFEIWWMSLIMIPMYVVWLIIVLLIAKVRAWKAKKLLVKK